MRAVITAKHSSQRNEPRGGISTKRASLVIIYERFSRGAAITATMQTICDCIRRMSEASVTGEYMDQIAWKMRTVRHATIHTMQIAMINGLKSCSDQWPKCVAISQRLVASSHVPLDRG